MSPLALGWTLNKTTVHTDGLSYQILIFQSLRGSGASLCFILRVHLSSILNACGWCFPVFIEFAVNVFFSGCLTDCSDKENLVFCRASWSRFITTLLHTFLILLSPVLASLSRAEAYISHSLTFSLSLCLSHCQPYLRQDPVSGLVKRVSAIVPSWGALVWQLNLFLTET